MGRSSIDLLDLWAKKRVRVCERLATHQLVQWDVLAARVVLGPDGEPVLDGSPYLYPASAKKLILRVLRRISRPLRGKLPRRDEATFFKSISMVFHDLWLELVALRPLPTPVTAEGDEVVLCRTVFEGDLAKRLQSSQSRIAKMVAGDPSVSLDLLIRSLLILGTSRRELSRIISARSPVAAA